MRTTKQVIVVRKDLHMRKGKIAAQASHASMAVLLHDMEFDDGSNNTVCYTLCLERKGAVHRWLENDFTKVVVYIESESEMIEIYRQVYDAGIPCSLIKDAGKTEFNGVPTHTCIAIGPWWSDELDKYTGNLKLL